MDTTYMMIKSGLAPHHLLRQLLATFLVIERHGKGSEAMYISLLYQLYYGVGALQRTTF